MRYALAVALTLTVAMLHHREAAAHSKTPLYLDIYTDADFRALYPPFGGYARSYGACYEVLRDIATLYTTFYETEEGKAVSLALRDFDRDRDEYMRLSCDFQWDRRGDSFREKCLGLKSNVEEALVDFKASFEWEVAQKTQSWKNALAGYERFCKCMGW